MRASGALPSNVNAAGRLAAQTFVLFLVTFSDNFAEYCGYRCRLEVKSRPSPYGTTGSRYRGVGLDPSAMQDWQSLRGGEVEKIPLPREIGEFMQRHRLFSEKMRDLIDDYDSYSVNKSHPRADVWAERSKWGCLSREPGTD